MTDWQAGLVLLAAVPLVWALMYLGWRSRRRRQAGVAPPATAPPDGFRADLLGATDGVYVSTVTSGDWLDRVVAHGLGTRSEATLHVGSQGVWWDRSGAPGVFVPATDLVAVRRDRGQAGKYTVEAGVLVVTWRLRTGSGAATDAATVPAAGGEHVLVDTAFRPRSWADIASIEAGLTALLQVVRTGEAA